MRPVNLIPPEARKGRGVSSGSGMQLGSLGPAHFLVALLVIVVGLTLWRVLTDNTVNNRKATVAALQTQVATEQSRAARLQPFITFVQQAQAREQQIKAIAAARFPWKTKFDELAHVLPSSTYLTSLSGSISGAATSGASTTSAAAGTPAFTLAGCADTPNQNGTATLLRRLNQLPGVSAVNFQSSTRTPGCGNSFNLSLNFQPLPGVAGVAPPAPTAPGTATTSTTTTATATTATTATTPAAQPAPATPAAATTTTTTGAAG